MGQTMKQKKVVEKNDTSQTPIKKEGANVSSSIIIVTLLFCTLFFLWDIIFSADMLPSHPSDLIELSVLHRIDSLVTYHQFPLWNDMWISGFPEYASPISELYNPLLMIPYILLGLIDGVKFITVSHVFLAGIAFWLFSTTITPNKSVQLYGSLLFMLSGSITARLYPGHTELMTTQMFIPLTMFFITKSLHEKDVKYIILSAISMAMFIFGGAAYLFVFFAMLFFVYSFMSIVSFNKQGNNKISINQSNLKILTLIFVLCLMLLSIKIIPILNLTDNIIRNDPIEPFKGSILLKDSITYFVNGGADSSFSNYESYAYIGFLPAIFAFLSVFNKSKEKKYMYPSFVVLLLWAGGNLTLFGWIHLLPFLDNFRVPGRAFIFASFILISLSLYGLIWFLDSFEKDKKLVMPVLYSIALVIFFEAQEIFINLFKNLQSGALEIVGVALITSVGCYLLLKRSEWKKETRKIAFVIILFSVLAVSTANIQFVNPVENKLNDPTAQKLMTAIKDHDNGEHEQIWITTTGWPYYHTEMAYNSMINGIHIQRAYYAYYLKNSPSDVVINNTRYYTSNYVVDTQYLDSGEPADMPATFNVDGVSVYKFENSLSNAFIVRNQNVIPLEIKYYSPNKVVASGSNVRVGDVVMLKTTYYDGWKFNGQDAENIGNMVGGRIDTPLEDVIFTFSPSDFKFGASVSLLTIIIFIFMIMKRDTINIYIRKS